jgi:hypothetical protein
MSRLRYLPTSAALSERQGDFFFVRSVTHPCLRLRIGPYALLQPLPRKLFRNHPADAEPLRVAHRSLRRPMVISDVEETATESLPASSTSPLN